MIKQTCAIFSILFFASSYAEQTGYTENGTKVNLKDDQSWEYIADAKRTGLFLSLEGINYADKYCQTLFTFHNRAKVDIDEIVISLGLFNDNEYQGSWPLTFSDVMQKQDKMNTGGFIGSCDTSPEIKIIDVKTCLAKNGVNYKNCAAILFVEDNKIKGILKK